MKNSLKNFVIQIIVWLFKCRRKNRFNPKAPKILVVSTTALGDSLWATPVLRAIKKSYPKATVDVLTSKTGFPVFNKNPYVDKLILFKEPLFFQFVRLFKQLKTRKIEAVLFLHASQRLASPLCALLNPEHLISSKGHGKGLKKLFTRQIDTSHLHEIERRLKIASALKIKPDGFKLDFFFIPVKVGVSKKPFIVFHPGSKEIFRRWPIEYYINLGQKLAKDFHLIIMGTSKEKALILQITSQIENSQPIYHNPTLAKTASILLEAKLLVCNDSGPMHLAEALNIPIVTFFIPSDITKCGPLSDKAIVLKEEKPCFPCLKRNCFNPYCFYKIKPDLAYRSCLELLNNKAPTTVKI